MEMLFQKRCYMVTFEVKVSSYSYHKFNITNPAVNEIFDHVGPGSVVYVSRFIQLICCWYFLGATCTIRNMVGRQDKRTNNSLTMIPTLTSSAAVHVHVIITCEQAPVGRAKRDLASSEVAWGSRPLPLHYFSSSPHPRLESLFTG